MVEPDLAELVDHHRGVGKGRRLDPGVEQRRLAGAEKAGEHEDRDRRRRAAAQTGRRGRVTGSRPFRPRPWSSPSVSTAWRRLWRCGFVRLDLARLSPSLGAGPAMIDGVVPAASLGSTWRMPPCHVRVGAANREAQRTRALRARRRPVTSCAGSGAVAPTSAMGAGAGDFRRTAGRRRSRRRRWSPERPLAAWAQTRRPSRPAACPWHARSARSILDRADEDAHGNEGRARHRHHVGAGGRRRRAGALHRAVLRRRSAGGATPRPAGSPAILGFRLGDRVGPCPGRRWCCADRARPLGGPTAGLPVGPARRRPCREIAVEQRGGALRSRAVDGAPSTTAISRRPSRWALSTTLKPAEQV